jgi:hypothetical protein
MPLFQHSDLKVGVQPPGPAGCTHACGISADNDKFHGTSMVKD